MSPKRDALNTEISASVPAMMKATTAMKMQLPLALLLGFASPAWAKVPDMICRETATLNVAPATLDVWKSDDEVLFRFKEGNLYLLWPNRDEFLYNTVAEMEPGRFISGNKTIMFLLGDSDFKTATVVHSDPLEIRVTNVTCTKSLP